MTDTTKEPFFTASDFSEKKWAFEKHLDYDTDDIWDAVADIANAKLNTALGGVVYNHIVNKAVSDVWYECDYDGSTHTAQLFNVREIKGET